MECLNSFKGCGVCVYIWLQILLFIQPCHSKYERWTKMFALASVNSKNEVNTKSEHIRLLFFSMFSRERWYRCWCWYYYLERKKYFFYWHCNSTHTHTHARAQKSDFDAWQRAVRTFVQFCIRVRQLFQNQTQCIVIFPFAHAFSHFIHFNFFFPSLFCAAFIVFCIECDIGITVPCSLCVIIFFSSLFLLSLRMCSHTSHGSDIMVSVGWEKDDACVSMLLKCMSEFNEQRNVSV